MAEEFTKFAPCQGLVLEWVRAEAGVEAEAVAGVVAEAAAEVGFWMV